MNDIVFFFSQMYENKYSSCIVVNEKQGNVFIENSKFIDTGSARNYGCIALEVLNVSLTSTIFKSDGSSSSSFSVQGGYLNIQSQYATIFDC